MIPYDDLVAALAHWRAKQGLSTGGAVVSAAPAAPTVSPDSGKASGSGPKRAAPPGAPPKGPSKPAPAPAPLAPPPADASDTIDVDDHEALAVEDHALETVDEFHSAFGNLTADHDDGGEATSIGAAPGPRDSFGGATMPTGGPKGTAGGHNDW